MMVVSSTDPWHRASDLDKNHEHASFERTFASGLTAGAPMMVPVPALYGIPEDAAALAAYLRKREVPGAAHRDRRGARRPAWPSRSDYARAVPADGRRDEEGGPDLEFGGPGYQTVIPDWFAWPDAKGVRSWTGQFVNYMRERGRMEDFDFFSFEWYPFDDVCENPAGPLARHPAMLTDILKPQEAAGLPPDMPKVITEYGYSSFAGLPEVELPGAIVNAETAACCSPSAARRATCTGWNPNDVFQEDEGKPCNSWGNLMLFQFSRTSRSGRWPRSTPADGHQGVGPGTARRAHRVRRRIGRAQRRGQPMVTAYAVRRRTAGSP